MIFLSRPHATKKSHQRGRNPLPAQLAKGCVPFVAGCGLAVLALTAHAADSADAAIASVMNAFVKPGEPGCTAGVIQDGRLSHAHAFGLADVERRKPLDTHSSFNLASVSKQFTAFAMLLLQQDGKLKLDDPVVRYLPELAPSAQGVTLRHLMNHTGGLRDYIGHPLHGRPQGRGRHDDPRDRTAARAADATQRAARRRIRIQQYRLLPARRRGRPRERPVAGQSFPKSASSGRSA